MVACLICTSFCVDGAQSNENMAENIIFIYHLKKKRKGHLAANPENNQRQSTPDLMDISFYSTGFQTAEINETAIQS